MARRHGIERYSRSRWRSGKAILTAEAESQGRSAGQMLRELGETPAPPRVAERLGVEPGTPVWVRKRTTMIDGRPNQLADSYYELEVVAGTLVMQEDTGPGGGFARLEDAGYELAEISEEWTIRMPNGPESVALKLPAGTPVAELTRTTFDTTGRPVEVMLSVIAGDPRNGLNFGAVFTDGVSRFVDRVGLGTWDDLFKVLQDQGPADVIARIREEERTQLPEIGEEPNGRRVKRHDDATAVLIRFKKDVR